MHYQLTVDTDQANLFHYYPSTECFALQSPLYQYTNPKGLAKRLKKRKLQACVMDFEKEYKEFYIKVLKENNKAGIKNLVRIEDNKDFLNMKLSEVNAVLLPLNEYCKAYIELCKASNVWVEFYYDLRNNLPDIKKSASMLLNFPEVPLHVQLSDKNSSLECRKELLDLGLKHVYVDAPIANNTYCHKCKTVLLERDENNVVKKIFHKHGHCTRCTMKIPGFF